MNKMLHLSRNFTFHYEKTTKRNYLSTNHLYKRNIFQFCSQNEQKMSSGEKINKNQMKTRYLKNLHQQKQKEFLNNKMKLLITQKANIIQLYVSSTMIQTSYLWIYRKKILFFMMISSLFYIWAQIFMFSSISQDPFTKKKHWMIISEDKQKKFSKIIEEIFRQQLFIEENFLKNSSKHNQQLLKTNFLELYSKQIDIKPIQANQHIIICLPNQKILISNNLFRTKIVKEKDLQIILLLFSSLFERRYHIKELSLFQIYNFWSYRHDKSNKKVKLSEIYSRKYLDDEITETIQLISSYYNIEKSSIYKALKEFKQITVKEKTSYSINARLNLQNFCQQETNERQSLS